MNLRIWFYIGGIAPVVLAILAFFWMPEPEGARFAVEDEKQFPSSNPKYLFQDGLALITPLLWLLFALNLMGYFFLLSWAPTLLRQRSCRPPRPARWS